MRRTTVPVSAAEAAAPEPRIVQRRVGGASRARVDGGLDVWEYVFIARGLEWDAQATADYLREPLRHVERALAHYREHPDETDEQLRAIDEAAEDPRRQLPGVRVISL